jgi:hypothetical protein
MKRIAYALSFVAAAAMAAAPLAAQSSNGPWWDPGRTQTQTRGGTVYGRNSNVYGNQQADGQWRADSRDRNGNTIYVRTRYDSNGNLIREYATRNIIGRYNIISQQVLNGGQYGNQSVYGNQNVYGNRGSYDRSAQIRREQEIARDQQIRQQEIYRREQINREAELRREAGIRRDASSKNDRWAQNDGHDNGRHNGQYKHEDKNDKHHGHDH